MAREDIHTHFGQGSWTHFRGSMGVFTCQGKLHSCELKLTGDHRFTLRNYKCILSGKLLLPESSSSVATAYTTGSISPGFDTSKLPDLC